MIARLFCFVAMSLGFVPVLAAAPVPTETRNGPAPLVTAQVKSIDHLLGTLKTVMKTYLPPSIYDEAAGEMFKTLDPSKLRGVDTKRPWGLYASIGPGLLNGKFDESNVIALVPIADEKLFLDFLETIELQVEKKGDLYTFPIPDSPVEGSLRFYRGYAYIGIDAGKLDPKKLLNPAEVINDKESAAGVLRVRIDHLPADFKKTTLDELSTAVARELGRPQPREAQAFFSDFMRTFERWVTSSFTEGKELVLRFDVDPVSGSMIYDAEFEAVGGSELAKTVKTIKPNTNRFADLITPDTAAFGVVSLPFFLEDTRRLFGHLVVVAEETALKDINNAKPKEVNRLLTEFVECVKRTIDSGTMDGVACLRGPNRKNQFTSVGAVSVKEPAELEKAFREMMKVSTNKEAVERFKLDAFKVGTVSVHEIKVGDDLPPEAQKIFGKASIYFAVTADAFFITFGADGKSVITEVLGKKFVAKPQPMAKIEASGKRMLALLKQGGAPIDGPMGVVFDHFGKMEKLSLFEVRMEGGDRLKLRGEMGVTWLTMTLGLGVAMRGNFKNVQPMIAPPAVEVVE